MVRLEHQDVLLRGEMAMVSVSVLVTVMVMVMVVSDGDDKIVL